MSRKAQAKGKAKRIRVEEGERVSVGVDVHKKTYHVALWSHDREEFVTRWCQPSDGRVLIDRLDSIRPHVAKVFYEAGPTGFGLARELLANGYEVEVVSAAHTKRPTVQGAKTDRLDCQDLARQGAKKELHPVYIPTAEQERDRQGRGKMTSTGPCRTFSDLSLGTSAALGLWSKQQTTHTLDCAPMAEANSKSCPTSVRTHRSMIRKTPSEKHPGRQEKSKSPRT